MSDLIIATNRLDSAIESSHPIAIALFCLINPKFIHELHDYRIRHFRQPNPQSLYSSP